MSTWQDYDRQPHTVVGALKQYKHLWSPQLKNRRTILVWLPPAYDGVRRFPVLYMHDGQNLFDHHTSYVGEWQVDETLTALDAEGLAAIVVGIPNKTKRRMNEYSPYDGPFGEGQGALYIDFLLNTVKPRVDAAFMTVPDQTGIAGSSMGGLISLYGLFSTDAFRFVGVFSPYLEPGQRGILQTIAAAPYRPAKIYLDVGTREMKNIRPDVAPSVERGYSRRYLNGVRKLRDMLAAKGYNDLLYVEDQGAVHHEQAWARRLPNALRYLLGN